MFNCTKKNLFKKQLMVKSKNSPSTIGITPIEKMTQAYPLMLANEISYQLKKYVQLLELMGI
jgi:hypothetical protein